MKFSQTGCVEVCELTREEVDFQRLCPTEKFVAKIADNVVRQGDVRKPGFVVIPNTRDILQSQRSSFSTWERVRTFQKRLMGSLDRHLQNSNPEALCHQNYLDLPNEVAAKHYARAHRGLRPLIVFGLSSTKFFHMDLLQHIFICLCYGPTKNVSGGTPQFLDLFRMKEVLGYGSILDLVDVACFPGEHIYHPREQAGKLLPELRPASKEFIVRINGLDTRKMPMVIFTNRLEDGIMHGATRVRKKKQYAARPISYVAIGHA